MQLTLVADAPPARRSRVSLEAERKFRERIEELGGRVVEPKWLGTTRPHRVVCAAGHESRPRPDNVAAGSGICRTCVRQAMPRQAKSLEAERRFRERVTELGGQIIEPEWLGAHKPHRLICAAGHECQPNPASVVSGNGICRTCGIDSLRRPRGGPRQRSAQSHEAERRFRERVAELGGRIIEPVWLGSERPHRIICARGHECSPRPSGVRAGQGLCRACGDRYSRPTAAMGVNERRFREAIERLGGVVTEPRWLGVHKRHRFTCVNGHEISTVPRNLLKRGGGGCRVCVRRDPATAEMEFRQRVTDMGGQVVEPTWRGVHKPHRITCAAGHETRVRPGNVRAGQGICAACAYQWDVFYVVRNPVLRRVKLGITSGNPAHRLGCHKRDGYVDVLAVIQGLPDALLLERAVLDHLASVEMSPVSGREYFELAALSVILEVVNRWPAASRCA